MKQDKTLWIALKAYNSASAIKKSKGYKNLSDNDKLYIQCMIDYIEHTVGLT